jgi:hypothetical protein
MCSMLNPSDFSFHAIGEQRGTTCDKAACCCQPTQWAVASVSKGGYPCARNSFQMRENPSPLTFLNGTLTCNTNVVGAYRITLTCGVVLTATVA